MNRFWRDFEKFHNCKYPKFIKDILAFSGIDQATLADINEKTIDEIEKIINTSINENELENKTVLKSVFKNSPYEKTLNNSENFKFLIGHRLLLINLPPKFKLYQVNKTEKKELEKSKYKQLKALVNVGLDVGSSNEIEKPDHLKKLLLKLLNNCASTKANKKYCITQNQVKKFATKGGQAYCVVECPFCGIKIPCSFVSNWRVGNFNNHVLEHVRLQLENSANSRGNDSQNPNQTTESQLEPQIVAPSVTRGRFGVINQVENILK